MREIRVTRWETEDGRVFDTKKAAISYEFVRKASKSMSSDFCEDLSYFILANQDLVLQYINDIRASEEE